MAAYFRVLTAEGRGAIAVVRLQGPGAIEVADSIYRPDRVRSLGDTSAGRLRVGRAGIGLGDEVVAVRLSCTEPVVEFQCHGGAAAVGSVVRALEQAGAARDDRDLAAGATTGDRIRDQAMEDLAAAPTLKAAEILLDQAHGAFSRSLDRLIGDVERGASPDLAELEAHIERAGVGLRLLRGWKVVIAGRPNVGKSRLFNALAGFERSIVNPDLGVTRDVVTLRTAFGGWPVEISDTAGERSTGDALESLGIGRARRERRDADLVLLVLDRSEPLGEVDLELLEATPLALVAANKCDLRPAWEPLRSGCSGSRVLAVSAETGEGLDDLVHSAVSRLLPEPPLPGVGLPFRPEHLRCLEQARECLVRGETDGFILRLEEIRRLGATLRAPRSPDPEGSGPPRRS
jgi:tRNA modification GTPase